MKQQALDESLHCPDQSCGFHDSSPAAAGPLITPSENLSNAHLGKFLLNQSNDGRMC